MRVTWHGYKYLHVAILTNRWRVRVISGHGGGNRADGWRRRPQSLGVASEVSAGASPYLLVGAALAPIFFHHWPPRAPRRRLARSVSQDELAGPGAEASRREVPRGGHGQRRFVKHINPILWSLVIFPVSVCETHQPYLIKWEKSYSSSIVPWSGVKTLFPWKKCMNLYYWTCWVD